MTSTAYFGIDVSKSTLDLACETRFLCSFTNDLKGRKRLITYLGKLGVEAIAVEATGIYSQAIADDLVHHDYRVYVVQPGRVRAFAQSQGILAKTDSIDGKVIARFIAASRDLHVYEPTSTEHRRLTNLVNRRDQVVDDRTKEKCRLEACTCPEMREDIEQCIASLSKRIECFQSKINDAIKADSGLHAKSEDLQKETGVGPIVSTCLLVHLPELGTLNRQEIAALTGLAPHPKDSGKHKGKREIYGGRSRVRRALYLAARSASRFNPCLKEFYDRLVKKGKPKQLALIAVARKVAVRLNTLMRRHLATT